MELYKHQERSISEGLECLDRYGYFAIFHEVGLGKSRTLLEITMRLASKNALGALVISAPKSLSGSWREQSDLYLSIPHSFISWDASKAKTVKWHQQFLSDLANGGFPVLFINTEAFQRPNKELLMVLEKIKERAPVLLAVDESSDIKNPKAGRTRNLMKFGSECSYRVIMTGTEITNSPLDIFSQFEFLHPGFWGFKNFYFFRNYYAILEERYLSGGRTFKEITGFRKLNEIQDKIAPITSRARKIDCLDLPEKIHARLPVELSGESERVYTELKNNLYSMLKNGELVSVPNKIALFTKARQITGGTLSGMGVLDAHNAKLDALISELNDSSEQAIIWSCFTEEIGLICSRLSGSYVRFDGQTSPRDRDSAIEKFRSGEARLFVANPQAAGQGLNLQCAHVQYWYSLPNQAKQYEQAEGRIHRSGQTCPCLYKSIIAKETVDERIQAVLSEKLDIMDRFRSGTLEDLLDML